MGSKRFYAHAQNLLGGVKRGSGQMNTWVEHGIILYYILMDYIFNYDMLSIILCCIIIIYYVNSIILC